MSRSIVVPFILLLLLASCSPEGGRGPASLLEPSADTLVFDGTREATVALWANGSWSVRAAPSWLRVRPSSGTGDTTVTLVVDRSALEPTEAEFRGRLTFAGGDVASDVDVRMRFPQVTGTVEWSAPSAASARAQARPTDVRFVPGEVLVRFDEAAGVGHRSTMAGAPFDPQALAAAARDLAGRHGMRVRASRAGRLPRAVLDTGGLDVRRAVERLQRDARVAYAEPNYVYERLALSNDPYVEQQWHYDTIDLAGAWSATRGDPGVTAAVVDAGFWPHTDLVGNVVAGHDFAEGDDDPYDGAGHCGDHGTHVAGTVAATTDNGEGVAGVAPNVGLALYDIGDSTHFECLMPNDALIEALEHAAGLDGAGGPRVAVVNMSLGGTFDSTFIRETIAAAADAGVILVAASGNLSSDGGVEPVMYPAAYRDVVAVGATDAGDERTAYSNGGPELWLTAPGGGGTQGSLGVVSTAHRSGTYGYASYAGTSMATPHVAGVVALMATVNADLTPGGARLGLAESAVDLGTSGHDELYGHGRLDAAAAVRWAQDNPGEGYDAYVVRASRDGVVVAQEAVDAAGRFGLAGLEAGSYRLEAGSDDDGDGVLDESGETYGRTEVQVTYDGDVTGVVIDVQPQ